MLIYSYFFTFYITTFGSFSLLILLRLSLGITGSVVTWKNPCFIRYLLEITVLHSFQSFKLRFFWLNSVYSFEHRFHVEKMIKSNIKIFLFMFFANKLKIMNFFPLSYWHSLIEYFIIFIFLLSLNIKWFGVMSCKQRFGLLRFFCSRFSWEFFNIGIYWWFYIVKCVIMVKHLLDNLPLASKVSDIGLESSGLSFIH